MQILQLRTREEIQTRFISRFSNRNDERLRKWYVCLGVRSCLLNDLVTTVSGWECMRMQSRVATGILREQSIINIFIFTGQLYALEKFWAFLKYYKYSSTLQVDPKLKTYLAKFKTVEDFRALEVSRYILQTC